MNERMNRYNSGWPLSFTSNMESLKINQGVCFQLVMKTNCYYHSLSVAV